MQYLVSIEQGSANPSITTLLLIGDALGIGLPALVDTDDPPGLRVTRAGAAAVLWRGKLGGQAVLAAGTEPPDVAGDLPHGYMNASSTQAARFALTVFEPAVGRAADGRRHPC